LTGGKLDTTGTYVQEHGGPILVNEQEDSRPARFTGITDGKVLYLTVTYTDDNTVIGTFMYIYGNDGLLMKCL
jgi:hypothetical protein